MSTLNFFKVYSNQKDNLTNCLAKKGLVLNDTQTRCHNRITFTCELYFTNNPPTKDVKWVKELQKVFSINTCQTASFSAVVIVSFQDQVYAVTFGSSHFYVAQSSDLDFGLNIAARVIKKQTLKNSRAFGGVKTKSIESFSSTSDFLFEAGEAVSLIKGEPEDTNMWGRSISCGQSVQLRNRDFSIEIIPQLCLQLEQALSQPINIKIPTSTLVKKSEQKRLNEKLIDDIKQGHYMVRISSQQLSGVSFCFSDQYEYVCKAGTGSFPVTEHLSLVEVTNFVNTYFAGDYQKLLNADVEAQEDGKWTFSKKFITFVDYVDITENVYLEEGNWYQFDKNYLKILRDIVDKIDLDSTQEIHKFDEDTYNIWFSTQPSGLGFYRERYLNDLLEKNHQYANLDRQIKLFQNAKYELCDLFKDGTIFIVKIGNAHTLGYGIDQGMNAVNILQRSQFQVDINGKLEKVRKVSLWFFIERANPLSKISEINSIIFLTKLANWRKQVLLSGLQPQIRVSYK